MLPDRTLDEIWDQLLDASRLARAMTRWHCSTEGAEQSSGYL